MTRLPRSALVLSPLLLALAPLADDVSFHPADGSQVTRDYSVDLEFELGDLSVVADGQDVSEMVPADIAGTMEMAMKVTESFVRSAEGRPLELIRSFEEMRGEAGAMGQQEALEDFDKLEGKRVRFVWNEEEQDYDVSFHESEGDQADLEGLTADMDLCALLPGKPVEAGATWSVEARELESVLLFGFGSGMKAGQEEVDQLIEAEIRPQLEKLLDDFKTACEYKGEREEGGRKVGVVAVGMHGEGKLDLAGLIAAAAKLDAGEMPVEIDVQTADLDFTFDSKGELLWDLAGGHLHAFWMAGDVELSVTIAVGVEAGGESHSADADAEVTGTINWKVAPSGE